MVMQELADREVACETRSRKQSNDGAPSQTFHRTLQSFNSIGDGLESNNQTDNIADHIGESTNNDQNPQKAKGRIYDELAKTTKELRSPSGLASHINSVSKASQKRNK